MFAIFGPQMPPQGTFYKECHKTSTTKQEDTPTNRYTLGLYKLITVNPQIVAGAFIYLDCTEHRPVFGVGLY